MFATAIINLVGNWSYVYVTIDIRVICGYGHVKMTFLCLYYVYDTERVKRGIMSTFTLIGYFGQINEVEKFKFDLIECLYNYAVIHDII